MAKKLLTTPAGKAVFPRLTGTPDTKFDDAGVYKTGLKLTADEAADLVEQIDSAIQDAVAQAKLGKLNGQDSSKPPKKVKQADAPYSIDEETGDVTINFKMKASGTRKDKTTWTRKPAVFDAAGVPLKKDVTVGGGSDIKVSFEMSPFFTALVGAGVSLRLEAVQVLNLVEFGSRDASAYGFAVEEGYAGKDDDTEDDGEEETEDTDGGEDADF